MKQLWIMLSALCMIQGVYAALQESVPSSQNAQSDESTPPLPPIVPPNANSDAQPESEDPNHPPSA